MPASAIFDSHAEAERAVKELRRGFWEAGR